MFRKLLVLVMVLLLSLLAACAGGGVADERQDGIILLWYDWQGAEVQLLNELIAEYKELNPGVEVTAVQVSPDSIVQRFQDRSASGLGPDLLLLNASQAYELAEAGLIMDVHAAGEIDESQYVEAGLASIKKDDRLYGLPFALHTQVLYYNKLLVENTPDNLSALMERVGNGENIALNTQLENALWGVGSFGGTIFDRENRLAIHQGGFANWLDFLSQAQGFSGVLEDNDAVRLQDLFVSGEAAYLVGKSRDMPELQRRLGEQAQVTVEAGGEFPDIANAAQLTPAELGAEILGVASLPQGPNDWRARPILQTDVFAFSGRSSPGEQRRAVALAKFLTNRQQQSRLAGADIGRIPASSQVRVAGSLPEATLAVVRQSRTAQIIPYELREEWRALIDSEGAFYRNYILALQGQIPANVFASEIAEEISNNLGLDLADIDPGAYCAAEEGSRPNTLTIWHAMSPVEAEALADIGRRYQALCPAIDLDIQSLPGATIIDRYVTAAELGSGPDILIESSRWTTQLAEQGLIADLSEYVLDEDLEQFIPEAPASMRFQERLYGFPESVSVIALLYNTERVASPPVDLVELRYRIDPDQRLALSMSFFYGYWGLNPFGGFEFNSATGEVEEAAGLVPWLTWLQEMQVQPGVDLTFNPDQAVNQFIRGEAAYLMHGSWVLPQLLEGLGEENFAVAVFPYGRFGHGSPMLQVRGVMVNENSSADTADLVAFARYLNSPESQQRLLDTGIHVSASENVNLQDHPLLLGFQEQAKRAAEVTENQTFAAMEEAGNTMYQEVLLEGVDPSEAVERFLQAVENINTGE